MHDDPFAPVTMGNDELEENEKIALFKANGRSGFMPASMMRQLDSERLQIVADIQDTIGEIHERQQRVAQLVREARDSNMAWSAIGWSTGLTSEGARLKWGNRESEAG